MGSDLEYPDGKIHTIYASHVETGIQNRWVSSSDAYITWDVCQAGWVVGWSKCEGKFSLVFKVRVRARDPTPSAFNPGPKAMGRLKEKPSSKSPDTSKPRHAMLLYSLFSDRNMKLVVCSTPHRFSGQT